MADQHGNYGFYISSFCVTVECKRTGNPQPLVNFTRLVNMGICLLTLFSFQLGFFFKEKKFAYGQMVLLEMRNTASPCAVILCPFNCFKIITSLLYVSWTSWRIRSQIRITKLPVFLGKHGIHLIRMHVACI